MHATENAIEILISFNVVFGCLLCALVIRLFVGAASGRAISSTHTHGSELFGTRSHGEPDDDVGSLCEVWSLLHILFIAVNKLIFFFAFGDSDSVVRFTCSTGSTVDIEMHARSYFAQQQTDPSYRFLLRCELNVYWLLLFPVRYWLLLGHQPMPIPIQVHFHRQLFDFANKKLFLSIEAVSGLWI